MINLNYNNFKIKTNQLVLYKTAISLYNCKFFSISRVRLMEDDNSDNDSILSEYSDTSVSSDKSDLIRKIDKLEERLDTSKNASDQICQEMVDANEYLEKYVESNKHGLPKNELEAYTSARRTVRHQRDFMIDRWEEEQQYPKEIHNNTSVSTYAAFFRAYAKSFQDKGFVNESSGVAETIKESERLAKNLHVNSNNLTKDQRDLDSIKSKLEDVNNRNSGSLLDDYADTSTEMPTYMDED